ncbi:hypothetical protein KFK09_000177 [Dendrobium nobile]|uniref:E2F/DP family winged-helix DNA-binding domain-containing protein n=1 Tax=Dendrobium nobile TaxID=94219 RepID=A0A8T3C850_DENNO|nr:hypothetical protein KFK09_000177 [Dendrobium nobile]
MSGIDSSSLAEILPRPPNRQFKLGSEDFPPFRCVVAGVTEKGKVLVPSVNPFSCALPMSNDSIRKNDRATVFKVTPCEKTIKEEQKEAIDEKILLPESGKNHRKRRKSIAPLPKACEVQGSESANGSSFIGLGASNSSRYDSSLSLLTKKFLNLLLEAGDGTLDLNKAAQELDVQKRRMYDITNVLEGVGLIEKGLKNMIRLKATQMSRPKEMEESKARLRAEIEIMSNEEHRLDRLIRERQEQLAVLLQDENNKKWRYVTQEDINALPCFEDSTLIAIEAPHGTIVEVPDPNESSEFPQRLSMVLRSSIGPINCYLLSRHEERFGSSQTEGMDLCSKHSCFPMDEIMTTFHSNASKQLASESPNSQESLGGIVKIEPSDLDRESDYWFLSELGVRLAEIWTG